MSQRMSRREMRKAGLLKPRPAADSHETSVDELEAEGPQEIPAARPEEASHSPADLDTPSSPEEAPAEGRVASYDDDAVNPDGEAALDGSVEVEPPAPVGAESPEEGQAEGAPVSPAGPERTSVFDRFANEDDDAAPADESTESSAGDEGVATSVVKPEDADEPKDLDESDETEADDDFAGALRAKLKAAPPAEKSAQPDDADAEYTDTPSRWKTTVLFLLLIIVGFGVGILLGSVLFSSGAADASAQAHTFLSNFSPDYPGAL